MQITDLGGHSGCKILLCEDELNNVFVRKVSSSIEYNQRLIIQAQKQKDFCLPTIKTPKVLNDGYDDCGLYYFDMEYIQGITLAEYMKSIHIGDVKRIVETIVSEIGNHSLISDETDNTLQFVEKINALKQKIGGKEEIIDNALTVLNNHVWNKFVPSKCHGDLTLENIIIKDNQLYFIDFLDSFYDCWILDLSTLLQDVQTLWSYRFEEEININTILRLIVFRDILMDTVKRESPDDYIETYFALLLKLVRIIPYTHDEHTYDFLLKKIHSVMEIIRKAEENENPDCTLCRKQVN